MYEDAGTRTDTVNGKAKRLDKMCRKKCIRMKQSLIIKGSVGTVLSRAYCHRRDSQLSYAASSQDANAQQLTKMNR